MTKEEALRDLAALFAESTTEEAKAKRKAAKALRIARQAAEIAAYRRANDEEKEADSKRLASWAKRRTGYRKWKPIGLLTIFRTIVCSHCGNETLVPIKELFVFENGTAKAQWAREEGYDFSFDNPERIDRKSYIEPEPSFVHTCAECLFEPSGVPGDREPQLHLFL